MIYLNSIFATNAEPLNRMLKIRLYMQSGSSANIPWDEVIKKEARGTDDYDLGSQQITWIAYVITQKGIVIVTIKWYRMPKTPRGRI